MLERAAPGATFLVNSPYPAAEVWSRLPRGVQEQIVGKRLRPFAIDANAVASALGMGRRVNTILQTCFFAISGALPREAALDAIKKSIRKTYGAKGEEVVRRNCEAVDRALEHLEEVAIPSCAASLQAGFGPAEDGQHNPDGDCNATWRDAPAFAQGVIAPIVAGRGDRLPVSLLPVDGTYPTGTAAFEKRNIATEIPVWHDGLCIQCGKCAIVCSHATIRIKAYDPARLADRPPTFKSMDYRGAEYAGLKYTIQVAPEDCTGCTLCVEVCPARDKKTGVKALEMAPQLPLRDAERVNWDFFLRLPEVDRRTAKMTTVKGSQFLQPLFEYSGACTGCGETPYLKLATQLFGDRMVVANATGCSSIFGGNLPTTPWTCNAKGRGPAWSNSLFEDNAEFGYGMRLTIDKHAERARDLARELADVIGEQRVADLIAAPQKNECDIYEQRRRVVELKDVLYEFIIACEGPAQRRARARALAALPVRSAPRGWREESAHARLETAEDRVHRLRLRREPPQGARHVAA